MKLYEQILANNDLRYVDANSGESYRSIDFHESLSLENSSGIVFLYLDNSIESIEVFLNFIRSNFAIVPLDPKLELSIKIDLESYYEPSFVYDISRNSITGFEKQAVSNKIVLYKNRSEGKYKVHSQIKFLLSTSGTTGSSKMVKLSEDNILENARSILDYLPISSTDVTPLSLPLFYSYGLSIFTTNSIKGGKIICSVKDILMKEYWDQLEAFGFTSFSGVPMSYELLDRIGFCEKELPSIKYMTQAGGKLSEHLIYKFGQYGALNDIRFYVMYGQTEATARMSFLQPEDLFTKMGSIGKPVKNGVFALKDETNELLYSGPNIGGGYVTEVDDLARFEALPVLCTGDQAECDEQGFYYITGRLKRFAKIAGNRINLDEIESILKNEYDRLSVASFSNDDEVLSVAYVHYSLVEKDIRQFLSQYIHLHPKKIEVKRWRTLPVTPNNKIDYSLLRN